jgi:hypothetical protein
MRSASVRGGTASAKDRRVTEELAQRVMGWKVTRDRFIKPGRSWMPRWRFAPLTRLEDAFELLDRAGSDYILARAKGRAFTAKVRAYGRTARASGDHKSRTITTALSLTLGLDVEPARQRRTQETKS